MKIGMFEQLTDPMTGQTFTPTSGRGHYTTVMASAPSGGPPTPRDFPFSVAVEPLPDSFDTTHRDPRLIAQDQRMASYHMRKPY